VAELKTNPYLNDEMCDGYEIHLDSDLGAGARVTPLLASKTVGEHHTYIHTYIHIHGAYTVFPAEKSPYIRS
jgi:hypothetical protein